MEYKFYISHDPKSNKYIGHCSGFQRLEYIADTKEKAFIGIVELVLKEMKDGDFGKTNLHWEAVRQFHLVSDIPLEELNVGDTVQSLNTGHFGKIVRFDNSWKHKPEGGIAIIVEWGEATYSCQLHRDYNHVILIKRCQQKNT